jgi:hypothetical protein
MTAQYKEEKTVKTMMAYSYPRTRQRLKSGSFRGMATDRKCGDKGGGWALLLNEQSSHSKQPKFKFQQVANKRKSTLYSVGNRPT